jgi:glc operon protein GlcG
MPAPSLTTHVPTLNAAGARLVLAAAEAEAAKRQLKVSIAVVDNAGNLLAFHRTDGGAVTTIEAAIRKARTAVHLGAPTKVFEDILNGGMTSLLAFEFISPSQGGIPLSLNGAIVGAIGSSGSTGDDDDAIATAGATALTAAIT